MFNTIYFEAYTEHSCLQISFSEWEILVMNQVMTGKLPIQLRMI